MVAWIIGLSGVGKSTLARAVVAKLKLYRSNVILLDGDDIREVFSFDLGHSLEHRRINAERICRIGKWLDLQDIHVVCAVLSTFEESRTWNRQNLSDYYEVFVRSSWENLLKRDNKNLYRRAFNGEIRNVVGVDLPFPTPTNPDLTVENNGDIAELLQHVDTIVARFLDGASLPA